jgi:hypothetical protein
MVRCLLGNKARWRNPNASHCANREHRMHSTDEYLVSTMKAEQSICDKARLAWSVRRNGRTEVLKTYKQSLMCCCGCIWIRWK